MVLQKFLSIIDSAVTFSVQITTKYKDKSATRSAAEVERTYIENIEFRKGYYDSFQAVVDEFNNKMNASYKGWRENYANYTEIPIKARLHSNTTGVCSFSFTQKGISLKLNKPYADFLGVQATGNTITSETTNRRFIPNIHFPFNRILVLGDFVKGNYFLNDKINEDVLESFNVVQPLKIPPLPPYYEIKILNPNYCWLNNDYFEKFSLKICDEKGRILTLPIGTHLSITLHLKEVF